MGNEPVHVQITEFMAAHQVDVSSVVAYIKVLRLQGQNAEVGIGVRATRDINNPGNFTTVGNPVSSVTDLLQTLDITSVAQGELFVQFSVWGTSGSELSQAELATWIQG